MGAPDVDDAAGFADAAGPDPFDGFGLPRGPWAVGLWEDLCVQVEQEVAPGGWDQPAKLYGVVNPVDTAARMGVEATDRARAWSEQEFASTQHVAPGHGQGERTGTVTSVFGLVELGELSGHPVEGLWGQQLPDWVSAVALVTEVWRAPAAVMRGGVPDPYPGQRPSQRPDRAEMRVVQLVTKAGEVHAAVRMRGEDVEPWSRSELLASPSTDPRPGSGATLVLDRQVTGVLRRCLGVPSTDPSGEENPLASDSTVREVPGHANVTGDLLGRMALRTAARPVLRLLHDLAGNDAAAVSAARTGGRSSGLEEAGLGEMAAFFAEASPQDQAGLLGALFARSMVGSVAQLVWALTRPASQLPDEMGTAKIDSEVPEVPVVLAADVEAVVATVENPAQVDARQQEALLEGALQLAGAPLLRVLSAPGAALLFEERVVQGARSGWLDEPLAFAAATEDVAPSQAAILEALDRRVRETLGVEVTQHQRWVEARELVEQLRTAVGWHDPG